MKISAFNTAVYSKKQNNPKNVQNTFLKNSFLTDTVSFKSSGYLQEGFEYIDKLIEHEVVPFMADSKNIYFEAAKVGLNAQKSLEAYKGLETNLMLYKSDLLEDNKNPVFLKAEKYLKTAKVYENNMHTFDRLNELSNKEYYNTPEIKKELKELKSLVLSPDKDLIELKRFASSYNDYNTSSRALLDNVTLKNHNQSIVKRMENTQKRFIGAFYYMTVAPYYDALKLIKERKTLEKDAKNQQRDVYTLLKRSDNLVQQAQKLSESVKVYYEKKQKMIQFINVAKHNELPTPTVDELKSLYAELKKNCREIVNKNKNSFEEEYSKTFENSLANINMEKVDELLNNQTKKSKKIQSMIDDIKQEYIDKNNSEFMRNHGFNDED